MLRSWTPPQMRRVLAKEVHLGLVREWLEATDSDATPDELAMANGPRLHLQLFNKCTRNDVDFLTQGVEPTSKRACYSVVMTWHDKQPCVVLAQSFMRNIPPWATGTMDEPQSLGAKAICCRRR